MGDGTGIEWTDATPVVDRGGRRIRYYQRTTTDAPGIGERRRRAAAGQRWCRGCKGWLPVDVVRSGVCRPCANAEYRARYAVDAGVIRAQKVARKRGLDPLPPFAAKLLTEQFEGTCAYCSAPADTWDHIVPVKAGGGTDPGNIVPACRSCNSSKKDRAVFDWLDSTGRTAHPAFFDVVALDLGAVAS